jgi:hypothetical protein
LLSPWSRQRLEAIQQPRAQLMKPGEGDSGSARTADAVTPVTAGRPVAQVVENGRLVDAAVSGKDEGAALPGPDHVERAVQCLAFVRPPHQR